MTRLAVFLLTAYGYTRPEAADEKAFADLQQEWQKYKDVPMAQLVVEPGDSLNTRAVKYVCRLRIAHQFEASWIEAFLDSMRRDMVPRKYETMEETLNYMYGSAETVGMMVAKIIRINQRGLRAASMQARAIAYIDLLCGMDADGRKGQRYLPASELRLFRLKDVKEEYARNHSDEFRAFIHAQLKLYSGWQRQAQKLTTLTSPRYRPAILAAADMYRWSAVKIEKDAFAVYGASARPSRLRLAMSRIIHVFD